MYLGKNSRQKRELIDGLSSLLKWLIGTPDAKDAKRYDECINSLEKQELDLTKLMLTQTQITSSTIKNFNETIFKISYDEQILNENIDRLNIYLNDSQNIIFNLKLSEDISTISLQILESVINLENEINDCLASILFAKSNTIHPSIISQKKLYEELLMSNHIRTNKHLVIPVTLDNIHSILDSSTLSAYVYSSRLVYILDFPLIQGEPLNLYHIYSIPIQHIHTFIHTTILTEHTFLATSPNGQSYISTSDLKSCKTYNAKKRICTGLTIYDAVARPICELQILFSVSKSLPEICTTSTFEAQINTFQNVDNNQWLYILSNETSCILQCRNEVTHHKLHGAGILNLPKNCKLYTGYSTLTAFQTTEENVTNPIIIPDIRTDDCFEEINDYKTPNLIPIKINEMPLDSLKQIKQQIDQHKQEIEKIKSKTFTENNATTFSWIYFTLAMLMLAYVIYKICKHCRNKFRFNRHHRPNNGNGGCVQIFNNCFASSIRRHRSNISIPMATIESHTSMTDDEEDSGTTTPKPQRSGANVQSLF